MFNDGKIAYTYDATGTKLSKKVEPTSGTTVITDYLGGFQYEDNDLQFFFQPEGYVKKDNNNYLYVFQYKDHFGNVRLSYADCNNDGIIQPSSEILEENSYYPFGLKHQGYNELANANRSEQAEKYQYNGKEWNDALGLNIYEMDLRQYDPAIGRWTVQDPVIHHEFSPYNAFDNNPVYWADPSGANSIEYNWGSGMYNVLGDNGDVLGIIDPGSFNLTEYLNNPDSYITSVLYSIDSSFDGTGNGAGGSSINGGGVTGGGNGGGKSYKYKGECYSSSEMLYADLLIETILEEATLAYVYTVASVLEGSGFLLKKEFQMKGASKGTSFSSKYLAPAIDKYLKELNIDNKSKLPTHIRGNSLRGTTSVGRFVTRWNNTVATVALLYQVANILAKTNLKYTYIINGPYKYGKQY